MPLPTLPKRLGLFALFGAATGAGVGMAFGQVQIGSTVGWACGVLFGYFAVQ